MRALARWLGEGEFEGSGWGKSGRVIGKALGSIVKEWSNHVLVRWLGIVHVFRRKLWHMPNTSADRGASVCSVLACIQAQALAHAHHGNVSGGTQGASVCSVLACIQAQALAHAEHERRQAELHEKEMQDASKSMCFIRGPNTCCEAFPNVTCHVHVVASTYLLTVPCTCTSAVGLLDVRWSGGRQPNGTLIHTLSHDGLCVNLLIYKRKCAMARRGIQL
jgi:hypothetical protein